MGIISYFKEFCRVDWIEKFFFAETEPLQTSKYFRDFPKVINSECSHCLSCKMICPSPGAIDVFQSADGKWKPQIFWGHCFRCGYCVDICPEEVLSSGDLLVKRHIYSLSLIGEYKVLVNPKLCMGCGNCCTACPSNRDVSPSMGAGGTSNSTNVLMRVEKGKNVVIHGDLCKGCKVCEDTCPNGAIHVIRNVEAIQKKGRRPKCMTIF